MDESIFWRNYFCRIYYLRYKSQIDGQCSNEYLDELDSASVVFRDTSPVNTTKRSIEKKESEVKAGPDASTGGGAVQGGEEGKSAADEDEDAVSRAHAAESAALAAEVV